MANEKITCIKCESNKKAADFYTSSSPLHNGKVPYCKSCIRKLIDINNLETIKDTLRMMDRPFINHLWVASEEESINLNKDRFGIYMKNIGMRQYRDLTWNNSEFTSTIIQTDYKPIENNLEKEHEIDDDIEVDISGERNKEDVLRMLGYDPFEGEAEQDKVHLYNKLVDMLDESTLEDGFKLPAVIEIVKGFNQLDKINRALALITSDTTQLTQNTGGVKSLIDSKEKILKSMLALAKDNGISVNHNNNKSKGAGTLSGIIKTLQEKGIQEGDVNLFDIETSRGMRQVADISNKSILAQLQFDENDYSAMLMEQREIIQDLDAKLNNVEEENRKLKKEIFRLKGRDNIEE